MAAWGTMLMSPVFPRHVFRRGKVAGRPAACGRVRYATVLCKALWGTGALATRPAAGRRDKFPPKSLKLNSYKIYEKNVLQNI